MTGTRQLASQGDFETIKKMHNEEGKNYTEIARHFTDQGYRTEKGRILTQSDVSKFMLVQGYRVAKRASGNRPAYEQSKLEEISQVLNADLSEKLMIMSIRAIVKG